MLSVLTKFLSNLSQHVMVDGCLSKLITFVSGVLQQCFVPIIVPLYIIVFKSCTMHPQSPTLTIGGTVLTESDLVILEVKFDSKMAFEKHLAWFPGKLLKDMVS